MPKKKRGIKWKELGFLTPSGYSPKGTQIEQQDFLLCSLQRVTRSPGELSSTTTTTMQLRLPLTSAPKSYSFTQIQGFNQLTRGLNLH
jgi:hypothetical protein